MEATSTTVKQGVRGPVLGADTLRGDVRDSLLTHVRSMEGWAKLSQRQQQDKIDAIDKLATTLIRGSVRIIADQGFPSLDVRVSSKGKYGDGGIEMTCSTAFTPSNVTKISEHGNGAAILVFAEPGEYFGERRVTRGEPDQRSWLDDQEDDGEADAEAPAIGPDAADAMIEAAETLSGLTFNLSEWPGERRAEAEKRILAKGGKVFGGEPAGDTEAPAPEEPPAAAEASAVDAAGKAKGRSRRIVRELEPA